MGPAGPVEPPGPPAPAAPTPGGGGSGIPALKSFDATNPYRLLSRSIYNVLS